MILTNGCVLSPSQRFTTNCNFLRNYFDTFKKFVSFWIRFFFFLDDLKKEKNQSIKNLGSFKILKLKTASELEISNFFGEKISYQFSRTVCVIPIYSDIFLAFIILWSQPKVCTFCVVQFQRQFFWFQANNCVEEKEWLDLLTRMCSSSDRHVAFYHPGAFIKGMWIWWVNFEKCFS